MLTTLIAVVQVFFTAAAAANQEVARSHMMKRALISWFWGTVTAHITTILFGAPFVTAFWKTLSLSMWVQAQISCILCPLLVLCRNAVSVCPLGFNRARAYPLLLLSGCWEE